MRNVFVDFDESSQPAIVRMFFSFDDVQAPAFEKEDEGDFAVVNNIAGIEFTPKFAFLFVKRAYSDEKCTKHSGYLIYARFTGTAKDFEKFVTTTNVKADAFKIMTAYAEKIHSAE